MERDLFEKELQKLEPDEAKLKAWEAGHKEEIRALRTAYESELKAKYDWPKLTAADGR